jgi:hypothetical protein
LPEPTYATWPAIDPSSMMCAVQPSTSSAKPGSAMCTATCAHHVIDEVELHAGQQHVGAQAPAEIADLVVIWRSKA